MDATNPLPDWATLAALDDEALPLLDAALLIARDEYPELEPRRYALQVHASGQVLLGGEPAEGFRLFLFRMRDKAR